MNIDLSDYMPLLDAIDSIVTIVKPDGEIVAINSHAARILGYNKDELVGEPVLALHQTGTENEVADVMSELSDNSETICHLPIVAKNGIVIPVETHIYKACWDGSPVLFGFSKDIRKQIESDKKWKAVFYLSPIPVALTHVASGEITEVNDAWLSLMQYTREQVIGKTTAELGIFFDPRERDALLKKLENGQLLNEQVHFKSSYGHDIYGRFSATQIEIDGEMCWITSLVDETENVQLREQINNLQETSITSALEQLHQQLSRNKYITLGDDEVEHDWVERG